MTDAGPSPARTTRDGRLGELLVWFWLAAATLAHLVIAWSRHIRYPLDTIWYGAIVPALALPWVRPAARGWVPARRIIWILSTISAGSSMFGDFVFDGICWVAMATSLFAGASALAWPRFRRRDAAARSQSEQKRAGEPRERSSPASGNEDDRA